MIGSVLVRQLVVSNMRSSLGDKASKSLQEPSDHELVKMFLVLPNSKAVTIIGPRMLIVNCMLNDTRQKYSYPLRVVSWAAFCVHAIALGMSSFMIQMLSLLVLVSGTYLTATNAGASREVVGSKLRLDVDMGAPNWTRVHAYARLDERYPRGYHDALGRNAEGRQHMAVD